MRKEILRIANQIKENLKSIDDDGIYHALLDDIFFDIEQIEELIYNDEMNFGYDSEEGYAEE